MYRILALAWLACVVTASTSDHHDCHSVPQRPTTKAHPLNPGVELELAPRRQSKCCRVQPGACGGERGVDDSKRIMRAFHECNNGGTVVLDKSYTIGSPLDLTFLNRVDVAITGTITFTDDISYWTGHAFQYAYQNSSALWRFGGKDVHIYGQGVGEINGQGQAWYDAAVANATLQRPILMVLDDVHGGSVTGLRMVNPPDWFNFIVNSSHVLVSDMELTAASTSKNVAKNTDGWDTYRSDNIVIQNSVINNGDDCVSFKPNSTNIVVQGLHCNGSHGISVGSLGQYINEFDVVENVYVYNISMSNASDGARIKVWPGSFTPFQPNLNGGGGSGYVRNVTYDRLVNTNNDWAIELTQCYGSSNLTLCAEYPSNMTISDVTFKNMWGTTSKKYSPKVGTLVCSERAKCNNIQAHNISVQPPSGGTAQWVCTNMDNALLEVNCIA